MQPNDEDTQMLVELGKQIQFARIELGMSQLDLIDATGLGDTTIRRIEKGTVSTKISQLGKIAQALNTTISALFERVEEAIERNHNG